MSTNVTVVNLEGEVVLSTVDAFRTTINKALKDRKKVLVSLGQTEEIDLYGIQLLYGARRYAERLGREFHITGPVPRPVAHRLYEGGFVHSILTEGRELETALHEFTSVPKTPKGAQADA